MGPPGTRHVDPTHDDDAVMNGAPGTRHVDPTHDDDAVMNGAPARTDVVSARPHCARRGGAEMSAAALSEGFR